MCNGEGATTVDSPQLIVR